jgi:thiol-disulfide isomerase/thioredoxin
MNLAETKGKVLFLNLWATWCGPCRMEMPSIQRLYDSMKDEVTFVLVSNEAPDDVRSFMETEGYTMPAYTSDDTPPDVLSTRGIPTTFIVSPQGEIVLRHVGSADWDKQEVRDFLTETGGVGGAEAAE